MKRPRPSSSQEQQPTKKVKLQQQQQYTFPYQRYHGSTSSTNVYKIISKSSNTSSRIKCLLLITNSLMIALNHKVPVIETSSLNNQCTEQDLITFISKSILAANGAVTLPTTKVELAMHAFERNNELARQSFNQLSDYVKRVLMIRIHQNMKSVCSLLSDYKKQRPSTYQQQSVVQYVLNIVEDGSYCSLWAIVLPKGRNSRYEVYEWYNTDVTNLLQDIYSQKEENTEEEMIEVIESILHGQAVTWKLVDQFLDNVPQYERNEDDEPVYYDWNFQVIDIVRDNILALLVSNIVEKLIHAVRQLDVSDDNNTLKYVRDILLKLDYTVDHNSLTLTKTQNEIYQMVIKSVCDVIKQKLSQISQSLFEATPFDNQQFPDVDNILEEIDFMIELVNSHSSFKTLDITNLLESISVNQQLIESRIHSYKEFNAVDFVRRLQLMRQELRQMEHTYQNYLTDSGQYTCSAIREAQQQMVYYEKHRNELQLSLEAPQAASNQQQQTNNSSSDHPNSNNNNTCCIQ
jgi:hypothetical protein